ncbi:MAG: RNA-guided endonuclease TnpB family protein [Candidatus Thermoplasmatota archaeon]|nr:RNA-guided endonuclease TnpB family protein [Candidatus Thermoplasmatota archaeon]MCL5889217.1 RNA-guided endonuclease TnpB family protein [Candidatus Thermoplasmatota archaeon]
MFRTIKLKLPYDASLLETGRQFREACQIVLDYGFLEKTFNKNKLNRGTYKDVREKIPTLPSALVQTARDTASESLKQTKLMKKIHRKSHTIRYDQRTFKFYPDSHTISLATIKGRLVFPVADSPLIKKHTGKYTNAQVVIHTKEGKIFVMIQVEVDDADYETVKKKDASVVGIDRGIKNIAVLSNNMFFNSGHLKDVKGRYQYNRKILQHAGTRSAHRKLREMSGRERRFMQNANHVISKKIVNLPFDVFALEELETAKMRKKKNGKKFNHKLGSWSPFQLEQFMEYKAKDIGKSVIFVDPRYTSQTCSRCGHISKQNRNGSEFHCKNCNLQLHADLNASRNIEVLGRSEYFRLLPTSQSLRFNESMPTGMGEASNKHHLSGWGS